MAKTPKGQGSVVGMNSLRNDIGEKSGFIADGSHITKKGTPSGEGAMFNYLPPGQDISNQHNCDIRAMPLKRVTLMGFPDDGGFPVRDIPE